MTPVLLTSLLLCLSLESSDLALSRQGAEQVPDERTGSVLHDLARARRSSPARADPSAAHDDGADGAPPGPRAPPTPLPPRFATPPGP